MTVIDEANAVPAPGSVEFDPRNGGVRLALSGWLHGSWFWWRGRSADSFQLSKRVIRRLKRAGGSCHPS